MKRDLLYLISVLPLLTGCQDFPQQEKLDVQGESVLLTDFEQKHVLNSPVHNSMDDFTHIILNDTPYYIDGPQQARPQDGVFIAGSIVKVIQNTGSYSLVESAEGVKAYVAESEIVIKSQK